MLRNTCRKYIYKNKTWVKHPRLSYPGTWQKRNTRKNTVHAVAKLCHENEQCSLPCLFFSPCSGLGYIGWSHLPCFCPFYRSFPTSLELFTEKFTPSLVHLCVLKAQNFVIMKRLATQQTVPTKWQDILWYIQSEGATLSIHTCT